MLLIDCLPIPLMSLLDAALREAGLSVHDRAWRFAVLPTVTETNKPRLLSGRWEVSKTPSYPDLPALGQTRLEVDIEYEMAGETALLHIGIASQFKSAMAGGFSLRDL